MRNGAYYMPKGRFSEDLSGRRFGNLLVLERAPNKVYNNCKRYTVMFRCRCDCGKEIDLPAKRLRSGRVSSCGCDKKTFHGKGVEDLTGQVFGRWTVVMRAEDRLNKAGRRITMWHCRCVCGNEKDVSASSLKAGSSQSCGCLKSDQLNSRTPIEEIVGQKFGRWTVVGPGEPYTSPGGRSFTRLHCICKCGNESDVSERDLRKGLSKSCGCYRLERLREECWDDLSGRKFGEWTAIKRLEDRHTDSGNRVQQWLCRCSCGKEGIVTRHGLVYGGSTSCGHGRTVSLLEEYTQKYLNEHDWKYEHQRKYSGLVGKNNRPLFYDFLVYERDGETPRCLIECQGAQHYKPVDLFRGEAGFEDQKVRDALKRNFAKILGIRLIEITYQCYNYKLVAEFLDEKL